MGGVFAKNTSLETKFPSPFGSGNFPSLDWYFFANTPPKHDISVYNVLFDIKVILSKLFSYFVSFIPNYRFDNSKRPSNRSLCTVTNAIVASPRLTSSQPLSITPSVKMRRVIEPQVSEISCSDQEIRQIYV